MLWQEQRLLAQGGSKGADDPAEEIRRVLGLEEGDRLLFRVDLSGRVILEKVIITSVSTFKQE